MRTKSLSARLKLRRDATGWAFVFPAVVFFLVFTVVPIITAFYYSLTTFNGGINEIPVFNNFQNFKLIFTKDSSFFTAFKNVAIYSAIIIPSSLIFSLALAVLINSIKKGGKTYRAIYYTPGLVSAIAASTIFRYVFDPQLGIINSLLGIVGIAGPAWLEQPFTALISLVILSLWMGSGGNIIIFYSALKGVNTDMYEAARIDGAGNARIFFKITLPALKPTLFFVLTMGIIGSFQLFEPVLSLTGGGPASGTTTPVYLIFMNAFKGSTRIGYASAQAIVLFAVIILITLLTQLLGKED